MNQTLSIQTHILDYAKRIKEEKGLSMEDCDFLYAKDCNGINVGVIF